MSYKINRIYICYLLFGLFIFSMPSFAQNNNQNTEEALTAAIDKKTNALYEIEMIVFKVLNSDSDEYYPPLANLRYPATVDRFSESASVSAETLNDYGQYLLLDPEQGTIAESAKVINEIKNNEVIYHQRWRQIIPPEMQVRHILIEGGKQFGPYHELQGVVNFYVERYLHAEIDLWLSTYQKSKKSAQNLPPLPPRNDEIGDIHIFGTHMGEFKRKAKSIIDSLNAQELKGNYALPTISHIIRIQEKRRMRSREIHYFDHPAMGVLLYLTPIKAKNP